MDETIFAGFWPSVVAVIAFASFNPQVPSPPIFGPTFNLSSLMQMVFQFNKFSGSRYLFLYTLQFSDLYSINKS